MSEHEFEPVRGLPERLPAGERVLWQGSPAWHALARRVFHLRLLAAYFALLLAARAAVVAGGGGSAADAARAVLWLLPFACATLGLVALMAWLTARTAVYTITNRRVAMRIGVVLEVTFNLPFAAIGEASLRPYGDGTGDLPLRLAGHDRIAYLHLWPHARPWRVARPQPMLRCVPQAVAVAAILARALAEQAGATARTTTAAANDALEGAPALAAAHS